MQRALVIAIFAACAARARPFTLRDPLVIDTDMRPVFVPCRHDPDTKGPTRVTCAPREYISPFIWDALDNMLFGRLSRALELNVTGEARNVNSLDEVPDSSWFTNRRTLDDRSVDAPGSCTQADLLPGPDDVAPRTWVIDRGKDNGASHGFRVDVPGMGKYMLKTDDDGEPERATAASVISAAIYNAIGFNTPCEQVVVLKQQQLALTPNLKHIDNAGIVTPFDQAALANMLAKATQLPGGAVRMHASKWLPGLVIGPFRYIGTRADDPNDVIDHGERRELRGSRILAAWLNHWDTRSQNTMDVWLAANENDKRSSPGYVVHYILDTSDTLGGVLPDDKASRRLGHAYLFDAGELARAVVLLGADERPWDRAHRQPGKDKFNYFSARDFDPARWRPVYPNPAFDRMTERDAAWMARKIARFSPADIRRFVELGKWSNPDDAAYVAKVLVERQRRILTRYLTGLSPLGDVHTEGPTRICATDFARLRDIAPSFRYTAQRNGDALPIVTGPEGRVCVDVAAAPHGSIADADPRRRIQIAIRNGTRARPLIIHAYELETGLKIVGVTRE